MSRKDFQIIADCLRAQKPQASTRTWVAFLQWGDMVREFDCRLAATSDRYDSAKFLRACGYD